MEARRGTRDPSVRLLAHIAERIYALPDPQQIGDPRWRRAVEHAHSLLDRRLEDLGCDPTAAVLCSLTQAAMAEAASAELWASAADADDDAARIALMGAAQRAGRYAQQSDGHAGAQAATQSLQMRAEGGTVLALLSGGSEAEEPVA